MLKYQIVVAGIGIAYDGESALEANRQYTLLVNQSKAARSKHSGVRITLFKNYEILREYRPSVRE